MHTTISSRLTAHFQPDGGHLQHYLSRKHAIRTALCEDLILHDQILIPTPDFLSAAGLVLLFGENAVLDLLEQNRIKFIRTRCVFGYARGTENDGGIVVFHHPQNLTPQDSAIEDAVRAGLSAIPTHLKERAQLYQRIVQSTTPEETAAIVKAVTKEAIADLKHTPLWKSEYNYHTPDLLLLPGVSKMEVRVIGEGYTPRTHVVDTLLALCLYNSDVYLSQKYKSTSISPFSPIGDLLNVKIARVKTTGRAFWTLCKVNGVPDLGALPFSDEKCFKDFHRVTMSSNAVAFRNWFHSLTAVDETEMLKEFISLLHQVPFCERLPMKLFRFAITSALGFVPIVGQIASVFDTFVVDKLFRGGAKFFMDDLNKVSGTFRTGANKP